MVTFSVDSHDSAVDQVRKEYLKFWEIRKLLLMILEPLAACSSCGFSP